MISPYCNIKITHAYHHFSLLRRRKMKKGTPITAMKIPAGSSDGLSTVRPRRSESVTKAGPIREERIRACRLFPEERKKAICGVTNPTNPKSPENVTAEEAMSDAVKINVILILVGR